MEDQYVTSPNTKDNISRKSEARLLTENKVNTIIADLIEKTKILAEELKNSNKIAAELMLQNSDLRKKYTNLKDKFLQFLNDEEIIDYMESDQNLQQSNGLVMKIKQYENQLQNLKTDNYNLDILNQKQQQQIQDLQVKITNHEKSSKANEILKSIDQNKDQEIKNLKEQLKLLQDQVHSLQSQQHFDQYIPQNQYNETELMYQPNKNSQKQPTEKMARAQSQIQLSYQNNSGMNTQGGSFFKKPQNQQSNTAFNSPGNQSGRDSGNYVVPQLGNNPSQSTLEYNNHNQRRPLSQKNSYYNRNFNLDYNELLYSEQANEYEDQEVIMQQQKREENNKNQGYQYNQNKPYSYNSSQQQQGHYNNSNYQLQNQNYPQTVFTNTQQYTNENQENNGSFENRQLNSTESNRIILSGGAGKSLIDPQKAFGRHQKSPSYMDPQQAAKYARSSALKKNQPIQKAPGLQAAYNRKKV